MPSTPHITGTTRVFMVVGDPIAQVQAPRVFNALFQRHGVDAVLVPAQVSAAAMPAFARAVLAAGNIDGLWVTVPHKPALAALVDGCDTAGTVAGAVNAVRRQADGRLQGGLFDGSGFVKALRHFGVATQNKRALLVGAGGAGAAMAVALLDSGLACLALADLGERAQRLATRLAPHAGGTALRVLRSASAVPGGAAADPEGFDIVINATPLGLKSTDPLPFDVARLSPHAVVVDILMKPLTPLLRACGERGIAAHPGFEMLVQQVPDYLDFFGLHAAARATEADLSETRALMLGRPVG